MEQLINIKGTLNTDYDTVQLNGQMLVLKNNWFEGIVNYPNSPYKMVEQFIFGIYNDDFMELYKFSPLNISKPMVLHGKKEKEDCIGTFEKLGTFKTMLMGTFKIKEEKLAFNSDTIKQKEILQEKIQKYKETMLDKKGESYYQQIFTNKDNLKEIIANNYLQKTILMEEYTDNLEQRRVRAKKIIDLQNYLQNKD